jgi:hypothetical protein
MVRIIVHILQNTSCLTFCLRHTSNKNHSFVVFWVVVSWAATNGTRGQHKVVTAQAMGPNS